MQGKGVRIVDEGYMESVMMKLRSNTSKQFPLSEVNVSSWRTIASRMNKRAGYKKFSVIKSGRLGIMVIKHNAYE